MLQDAPQVFPNVRNHYADDHDDNNHSSKDLPFIFMTRPPRAPRLKKC